MGNILSAPYSCLIPQYLDVGSVASFHRVVWCSQEVPFSGTSPPNTMSEDSTILGLSRPVRKWTSLWTLIKEGILILTVSNTPGFFFPSLISRNSQATGTSCDLLNKPGAPAVCLRPFPNQKSLGISRNCWGLCSQVASWSTRTASRKAQPRRADFCRPPGRRECALTCRISAYQRPTACCCPQGSSGSTH